MRTRTRFAPSPTGYMHIGNLRTAIFAYVLAKHDNGDFILRIEDTDQERKVDGAIEFIYNTLKLCNMNADEGPIDGGNYGPYIQSYRKNIYQEYAHKLVELDKAYYCFCSEERLNELRTIADNKKIPFMYDGHCKNLSKSEIEEKIKNGEKYVIRQKMPKEGTSVFEDLVYGKVSVENAILEDQILLKSDGLPTYNFANVIDDHLMEISHVIRGNEYLSQTPKYNLLYDAFGWEQPKYIHVSMVLGEDGNKLSKRNGDASFMDLYNEGYIPEAIVNYLVLLGWSPQSNQEIFSMEEIIKNFDPLRINKSPSQYDIKKLRWVNSQYIKKMELNDYIKLVKPFLESTYDLSNKSEEYINTLLRIYQNHISCGKDIIEETKLFFTNEYNVNEECLEFLNSDPSIPKVIETFAYCLKNMPEWTVENINNAINETKEKTGVKGKLLYMPIRIKISGIMHGPELAETIYLIGSDLSIERLNN